MRNEKKSPKDSSRLPLPCNLDMVITALGMRMENCDILIQYKYLNQAR